MAKVPCSSPQPSLVPDFSLSAGSGCRHVRSCWVGSSCGCPSGSSWVPGSGASGCRSACGCCSGPGSRFHSGWRGHRHQTTILWEGSREGRWHRRLAPTGAARGRPPAPLTSREHLGTLAEAVVIVGVTGAESSALQCQATLLPSCATVVLQRQPVPSRNTATVTADCLGGHRAPSIAQGCHELNTAQRDVDRDPAVPAWPPVLGPQEWRLWYAGAERTPKSPPVLLLGVSSVFAWDGWCRVCLGSGSTSSPAVKAPSCFPPSCPRPGVFGHGKLSTRTTASLPGHGQPEDAQHP